MEHEYLQDNFDEGYYGKRARSGFGEEVFWDNPAQQDELKMKFKSVGDSGKYNSILFIGCAFGNEVRYFRNNNKEATGVEISEYAVSIVNESIKGYVKLYNGWELKEYKNNSVDIVASFDVLTLIPEDMLKKLVKEMCRVSSNRIVVKTSIDTKGRNGQWAGNDGVSFRLYTMDYWIKLFVDENFIVKKNAINLRSQVTFLFTKGE